MSDLARLARRVMMTIGFARQTADTIEAGNTATAQMNLGGGELRNAVPHMQLFGFASRPMPGTDHTVVFQGGNRRQGVSIASGHQASRPKDLAVGEVCVFHPGTGSRVWLRNDGSIALAPANGIVTVEGGMNVSGPITAPEVTIAGIKHSTHEHTNGNQGSNTGHPIAG